MHIQNYKKSLISLLIEGDEEITISDDVLSTVNNSSSPSQSTLRTAHRDISNLFSSGDNIIRSKGSELFKATKDKILDFLKGSAGSNTTIGDLGENAAVEWLKDHFSTTQSYNTNEMSNNFPFADNVVLVSALNGAYKKMARDAETWNAKVAQEIQRTIVTIENEAEASDDSDIQAAAEEGIEEINAAAPSALPESKKKKLSNLLFEAPNNTSKGVHTSSITQETRQEVLLGTINWFRKNPEARGIYKNPSAWVWISTKASGAANISGGTINSASPFNSPIHNAGSDGLVILEIINLIRAKGWEWIEGNSKEAEMPNKEDLWNECQDALSYFKSKNPTAIDTGLDTKSKIPKSWDPSTEAGQAIINILYNEFKANYIDQWILKDTRSFRQKKPGYTYVDPKDPPKSGYVSTTEGTLASKLMWKLYTSQSGETKDQEILDVIKQNLGGQTINAPTLRGTRETWSITNEDAVAIISSVDINKSPRQWIEEKYPTWPSKSKASDTSIPELLKFVEGKNNIEKEQQIKIILEDIIRKRKTRYTPIPKADPTYTPPPNEDPATNTTPKPRDASAAKNPNLPVSHINLGGIGLIIKFGSSEDDIRGVKWNYGWTSFKEGDLVSSLQTDINSWVRFVEFIEAGSGKYKVLKQLDYSLDQLSISQEILSDIIARRRLGRKVGKSIGKYSPSRVSLMSKLGDIDTESGEDKSEFDDLNYLLNNRSDENLRAFIRKAILAHQSGEDLENIWFFGKRTSQNGKKLSKQERKNRRKEEWRR